MKTDDNLIESFIVKVARDKNADTTENLHVTATIKTFFENVKIEPFSKTNLYNFTIVDNAGDKSQLLKLDIYVILPTKIVKSTELFEHKNIYKFNKNEAADFEFDAGKNSVFLIEAKIKAKNSKPEGTKRKVITYEDSDIIE